MKIVVMMNDINNNGNGIQNTKFNHNGKKFNEWMITANMKITGYHFSCFKYS